MEQIQEQTQTMRLGLRRVVLDFVLESPVAAAVVFVCFTLLGWGVLLFAEHDLSPPNVAVLRYYNSQGFWGGLALALFVGTSVCGLYTAVGGGRWPRICRRMLIVALFADTCFFWFVIAAMLIKVQPTSAIGNYFGVATAAAWAFLRLSAQIRRHGGE